MDNVTETLEALIDKHGLLHVVTALDLICTEKADHIRTNWQDRALAKDWDRAANATYTLSKKVEELGL
jgi:hypothetical protein